MSDSSNQKKVSESFVNQISVLRAMSIEPIATPDQRALHITEIAEKSGVTDEKEIQRYLFILEGQKLVTPQPEGDFTSRTWAITKDGMKVVRKAQQSQLL